MSVAVKAISKVMPPWLVWEVKVKTPVSGSKIMPDTRFEADRVTAFDGSSESVAVTVKARVLPAAIVWGGGILSIGARLTSVTVMVKVSDALT